MSSNKSTYAWAKAAKNTCWLNVILLTTSCKSSCPLTTNCSLLQQSFFVTAQSEDVLCLAISIPQVLASLKTVVATKVFPQKCILRVNDIVENKTTKAITSAIILCKTFFISSTKL